MSDWWRRGAFASAADGHERAMRRDAGSILRHALSRVDPEPLTIAALSGNDAMPQDSRVRILAFGKAASAMARGALTALGPRVRGGLIVTPTESETRTRAAPLEVLSSGHPVPDQRSVEAARAALRLIGHLAEDEVLLCLISGGGSALLALPRPPVTLEDLRATTDLLLRAGATVEELNAVRRKLDAVKGGLLAREVQGPTLVLAVSDVIGDAPETIASGPFSPDPTTFADAVEVLRSRDLWTRVPASVRATLTGGAEGRHRESPGRSDPCFERVRYRIIASAGTAAAAARDEASRLGYDARVLTTTLAGEARDAGMWLAREAVHLVSTARSPACFIATGETTVTVRGNGRGGRNQELALASALELENAGGTLIASLGTDGVDGPTDAAGAVATWTTVGRARAAGLDPRNALERNDSHSLFSELGDCILTGPTGTNVMDLQIALAHPRPYDPRLDPWRLSNPALIS